MNTPRLQFKRPRLKLDVARVRQVDRRTLVWIGIGVLALLFVISRVVSATPGSGSAAVDSTGASRGHTAGSRATPRATATPRTARAKATPVVISGQVPITADTSGPIILLNPGIVRQGASVNLTASGFDARAAVDLVILRTPTDQGQAITFAQADRGGSFSASFTVPASLSAGSFIVEARERNSNKVAQASGAIDAGSSPVVKLGTQVGKAGDSVVFSAQGFTPNETVSVYWNSLQSQPIAKIPADGAGGVRSGSLTVPFGAVGNNAFIFLGAKSQAPITASFLTLSLYPSIQLSSYAIQADNVISFSGKDFGPGESVAVYLNSPTGQPIATAQADTNGAFGSAGGFVIPFALKGKQTLIFIGERSRAPTTASFDILPYTPSAQPSTYGGLPGTAISFYAMGFARGEVVHIYTGHSQNAAGTLVGCFRTDNQGSAGAAGSYVVPGNVSAGKLAFTLIGNKSGGVATATVQVMPSSVPVQVPSQPPFTCALDQQTPAPGAAPSTNGQAPGATPGAAPNAAPTAPAHGASTGPATARVQATRLAASDAGAPALLLVLALPLLTVMRRSSPASDPGHAPHVAIDSPADTTTADTTPAQRAPVGPGAERSNRPASAATCRHQTPVSAPIVFAAQFALWIQLAALLLVVGLTRPSPARPRRGHASRQDRAPIFSP